MPSPKKVLTQRQQILRGFAEIIRECGDKGVGTGLERSARWRNPAPGGRGGQVNGVVASAPAAGNSANAAVAADAVAKKVSKCSCSQWLLTFNISISHSGIESSETNYRKSWASFYYG